MAKYVPDSKTQRWVVIAPTRLNRPESFFAKKAEEKPVCPFCPGNETLTPPEVYRIGPGETDAPGWTVRVVPNKYPITDIHEVIIHGPDCEDTLEHLPHHHVEKVLTCYRDRYRAHENDGQVLIFCNQGAHAGASLSHPHSQLIVVPKQINFDALSREPIAHVVKDNTFFVTYCPDFSQWPFELWIAPKAEGTRFGDIDTKELSDLASVLSDALKKVETVYADTRYENIHRGVPFGYNFYIYHGEYWYIRIIPRFIHRAGFELGTGLNVNVIDPSDAADIYKTL
jgi:UDPglucose--hexose-1-phosphate uridylyltransferase